MAIEVYQIEDFDRKSLEEMFKARREGEFLSVWSPSEIKLLGKISPLTVKRINNSLGSSYQFDEKNLEDQAKIIASYITKSIDNSVFKGILRTPMVRSKVRNLIKVYESIDEECPISEEDVSDDNFLNFVYFTKQLALSFTRRYEREFDQTNRLQPGKKFEFIEFFKELFGENLERIVQYGSSVNEIGYDIDLIVFLKRFHRDLYNVIWGQRSNVPYRKPVGILMLPSNALTAYAECDYYSLSIAREGRLIYGPPLDFPLLSEAESIWRMYFEAGKSLTSIRGALGDSSRLEGLARSPEFMADTLKKEIWIRKALLQQELGRFLTKEEFLELEPIPSTDLGDSPSLDDVKKVLYDANYRIKERIDKHVEIKYH